MRSLRGFGSVCNGCRGWESRIGDLLLGLRLGGDELRGLPLPLLLLLRVLLVLLRHWRVVKVVIVDDAPRSRSSRPMHAGWFAEDAVLRDLVENLPLLRFEVERQVGMPIDVSLEFCL